MRSRRPFLCWSAVLTLFLIGGGYFLAAPGDQRLPDGSLARGMINREAQDAIDKGLEYLARHQNTDGSFGTHQHRGNVAITSLASLALMAGGHQPGRGKYGQNVTRALQFVLDQEERANKPGFLHNRSVPMHGPMYGHGFGTLFLAEAQGMVHNKDLRERLRGSLERAVKLIINAQNHEGGWRYQPEPRDADISVTICQIMGLRAARNAGIAVPKSTVDRCTKYVLACQDIHGDGGFRYMIHPGQTGFARTAAGVVALYSAGIYKGDAVKKGLEYLMTRCKPGQTIQHVPQGRHDHYYYGHYYAVQAMWLSGGRYWTEWFPAIRDELLNHADRQPTEGCWQGRMICPHYSTAMACIILQVPNNYLPILQR